VENVTVQASVWEDGEGLISMVTLLEGELAEAREALEVAEEKLHSLSDTSADGAWWLVIYEMEHREQFEVLSLLPRCWC
jgi:NTP pyrophosphatase (non-canonical NTP hydrolase)